MKKTKFISALAAAVMGITAVSADSPAVQANAESSSDLKIMCIGDSITHGYINNDNGYLKYLCYYLQGISKYSKFVR